MSIASDIAELGAELNSDIKSQSIGTLCSRMKDGNITFLCFKSALPLLPMLENLFLLAQNDLFSQLWREKIPADGNISITIVSQHIWPKAYGHAQQLMDALYGRKMKLADVDHYLSKYKARVELTSVLRNLNHHLNTFAGLSNDDSWIGPVVETIMQYRSLTEHEKAAKIFLHLQQELKLTGSFKQVETLASQVRP